MERYSLLINVLSPVHIGCGAEYDPLGYVIDAGRNELCAYKMERLRSVLEVSEFGELAAMAELPGVRGLKEMRRFVGQRVERVRRIATHQVAVAPGISEEYRKAVSGGEQFEIARTFYHPYSNAPIIPGSSIKGAIRTAVLSYFNDGNERPNKYNYQRELLRGVFSEDPFRLIKIGDAAHKPAEGRVGAKVVYAVNRRRGDDNQLPAGKGLVVRLETIPHVQDKGYSFSAAMNFLMVGDVRGKVPHKERRFDFWQLAEMCNRFYGPKLTEDLERLSGNNERWRRLVAERILKSPNMGPRLKANEAFILRIGHHSGAESVTMDGARQIMIRRGRGQRSYEKQASTQWFAAEQQHASVGFLPFGWVLVVGRRL